MKKFLSLVLALVMAMSLVTVSAGAKDFNDSDKISDVAYEEAVNVMSEMGIIDGYTDGNFQPQGTLTRGAAAKIIACMMLGKTTAEALGTQAAPFKDVPVGSTFAGYIAYCSESGIIDGYSDGTFRPGNTLTGFAFLKMLLTALGYDSSIEGYANNANWTVNVAGRAKQIGLLDGNDNFVGTRAATREEACLYAVNALQATLVEYSDKGGNISVGDITINTSPSNATYVTSNVYDQATSIDATRDNSGDWTVEFAEKYQPDLRLDREVDAFGRPSHTWTWKRVEIGSYIDQDKFVAEYTAKVTGRDLYDLLGSYVVDNDEIIVTIDGVDDARRNDNIFGANNIIKSNTNGVGATGNGVLTQVFRDSAEGITYIAIINTYLAIATDDYDEKDDTLDVEVYAYDHAGNNPANIKDTAEVSKMTADNEDVPVAGYEEDDIILVRIADGEILEVMDPEILSDATLTAYSLTKNTITSGGTTYDKANTRLYDEEVLTDYSSTPENLKDLTYNIILDPYGYFIGLELNEDPDQYVFITGYEEYTKNLTSAVAEAGAIFADGTMENIDVKVKDTLNWNPNGNPVLNSWYTYSVNSNGQYTLGRIYAADADYPFDDGVIPNGYADDVAQYNATFAQGKDIDKSHISLPGWNGGVVYGNADSVYVTVDTEVLSNTSAPADVNGNGRGWAKIVDDVISVTTGVKNANLSVLPFDFGDIFATVGGNDLISDTNNASGGVYTLYDDKGYVIASIVVGEDDAASTNYVFAISEDANLETYSSEEDEHTWTREVIVNGELKELVYKGDSIDYIGANKGDHRMVEGNVYKVSYNTDGEVIRTEEIVDITYGAGVITGVAIDASSDQVITAMADIETNDDAILLALDLVGDYVELSIKGWSLFTSQDPTNGVAIADNAKAVLIERVGGKAMDEVTYFDSKTDNVADAIDAMYDDDVAPHSEHFSGVIYAILEDGVATSVIFVDDVSRPDVNDGGSIVTGDNVATNGDITMTVPAAYEATSVRISSSGAIAYEFNVGAANKGSTIVYTRSISVEGDVVSRVTGITDTVAADGSVIGSVNIGSHYDKGDEVTMTITVTSLSAPEDPEVPEVPAGVTVSIVGSNVYVAGAANDEEAVTAIKATLLGKGYETVDVTASSVSGGYKFTFKAAKTVAGTTVTDTYTYDTTTGDVAPITVTVNGDEVDALSNQTVGDVVANFDSVGFVTLNGDLANKTDALTAGDVIKTEQASITGTNGTVYGEPGEAIGADAAEALAGNFLSDGTAIADVVFPTAGTDSDKSSDDNCFKVTKTGSDSREKFLKAGVKVSSGTFNLQGDYVLVDDAIMAIADAKNVLVEADMTLADNYYELTVTDDADDAVLGDDSIAWGEGVVTDADGKFYAQVDAVVTLTLTTVEFTVDGTDNILAVKASGSGSAALKKVDFEKGSLNTAVTVSSADGKLTFGKSEVYASGTIVVELTVSSTPADNGVELTWGNS